ncbi:hypothetical protein QBZ16_001334 [Prototheca wickerhamii]|uniref:Uncharacterized protein n=1 Tax=Prototheca wickerhamii TaxID=3111 RepID=A0AAD9IDL4_PROWI|nr:hypothetical protein QBZ16_001334 [Prototheca wickerhamii]
MAKSFKKMGTQVKDLMTPRGSNALIRDSANGVEESGGSRNSVLAMLSRTSSGPRKSEPGSSFTKKRDASVTHLSRQLLRHDRFASGASTKSAGSSTAVRRAAKAPKQQPKAESKGSLLKNVAWLVGATALGMLAASQVAGPRRAHPKRRV